MDLDLTPEQSLLKDTVDRLIADRYGFDARRRIAATPEGWSADLWAHYAELGLLGLPFAERHGGFGGGPIESMIVMEAFGRGLVLEPYFASVILGGGLIDAAADEARQQAILPQVAAGRLKLAFAQMEAQAGHDLAEVATLARRDGDGWIVDGAKTLVLHGQAADRLIVSARTAGARNDRWGIGLFLVDAAAPGIARHGYATQDGLRAADIVFDGVPAERLDAGDAFAAIEAVAQQAIAALCAEAVGVMSAAFALTIDYLKTRRQFGQTIGAFQALQHRAADMYVLVEQARGMALLAATALSDDDPMQRWRSIAAAKAYIGQAGRRLGQEAVQLHGGIGMTMEYAVGHYFKRLTVIDLLFGDADMHLAEVGRLGGLIGGERDAL
jgi:pimeloyl-CoA dehydrogenase small subunit